MWTWRCHSVARYTAKAVSVSKLFFSICSCNAVRIFKHFKTVLQTWLWSDVWWSSVEIPASSVSMIFSTSIFRRTFSGQRPKNQTIDIECFDSCASKQQVCVVLFVFIGGEELFSNVGSCRALSRSFHTCYQKDIHSEVTNGCLVVLSETFWWSVVRTYMCDVSRIYVSAVSSTVIYKFKYDLDGKTNFSHLSRSRVSRLGSTHRICSLIFNISGISTSHVIFPRRFPVDRMTRS